jgi:hypothetical protein
MFSIEHLSIEEAKYAGICHGNQALCHSPSPLVTDTLAADRRIPRPSASYVGRIKDVFIPLLIFQAYTSNVYQILRCSASA